MTPNSSGWRYAATAIYWTGSSTSDHHRSATPEGLRWPAGPLRPHNGLGSREDRRAGQGAVPSQRGAPRACRRNPLPKGTPPMTARPHFAARGRRWPALLGIAAAVATTLVAVAANTGVAQAAVGGTGTG